MSGAAFVSPAALAAFNARKERLARFAAAAERLTATPAPRPVLVVDNSKPAVSSWGSDPCDSWFEILFVSPNKNVSIADVQRAVCEHFGLKKNDMMTARRTRELVRPRQIAMFLCKELTIKSLPEIGRHFGNRDHTTILHGVRAVKILCARDHEFARVVYSLRSKLEGVL